MTFLLPTSTSTDDTVTAARIAVLPIGSFEQHGRYLPLATDTIVACVIAREVAEEYGLFLLPPVTIACSHEHAGFPGSVSIRARTLYDIVNDIADSLAQQGINRLALINGHGGNYILSNIVQEASANEPRMALFPTSTDWKEARKTAGLVTSNHADMHAGELETSILLHAYPELVRPGNESADWLADDRRFLLMSGMREYTESGVIGQPSLGTAEKGKRILNALSASFTHHLSRSSK